MVAQQNLVAAPASTSEDRVLLLELLASGMTLPEFLETLEPAPGLRGRAADLPGRFTRERADPTALRAGGRASMVAPAAAGPSADPAHWYRATAPLWEAIDRAWPTGAEQAA